MMWNDEHFRIVALWSHPVGVTPHGMAPAWITLRYVLLERAGDAWHPVGYYDSFTEAQRVSDALRNAMGPRVDVNELVATGILVLDENGEVHVSSSGVRRMRPEESP